MPPATDADLRAIEVELGLELPRSYKRLMRITRGFWLSGGVIQLSRQHPFLHAWPPVEKLAPLQQLSVEEKAGGWPPASEGMVCFAEYFLEADGDQVLWDAKDGLVDGEYPVLYYAHEAGAVRYLARDFRAWLKQCLDAFPPAAADQ